ncbi:hypothetical protein TIFTF001_023819 [Ficus carica]|uniref:Uncharacterized protein n=1 Tax=Ficus carica TaxID=3494 RepID=A0AA88AGX7_FICCA|nr:hypothetical protein TIFTF001_023819 [Ficus carica]
MNHGRQSSEEEGEGKWHLGAVTTIARKERRRQRALWCRDDNHQKNRKKTMGTWVQREMMHGRWDVIVRTGHNSVRDNNCKKKAHSTGDQTIRVGKAGKRKGVDEEKG